MIHIKSAEELKKLQALQPKYYCECLDCGWKGEVNGHCAETPCPRCGGRMRRVERPGVGR